MRANHTSNDIGLGVNLSKVRHPDFLPENFSAV